MLCNLLYAKRVDAFSLFYFKILSCKLSLFVLGGESHWQFIGIYNCFITDQCLSVVKLAWLSGLCARGKITWLQKVADSNPTRCRVFANSRFTF